MPDNARAAMAALARASRAALMAPSTPGGRMGVLGAILPSLLMIAVPIVDELQVRECADVRASSVCAYWEYQGVARVLGADVDGPRGLSARAHHDDFDGWSGRSKIAMAEASAGGRNVYWGTGYTDYDYDGVPDDVCVVCGGMWHPMYGYRIFQTLSVDGTGAHAVFLVQHEGTMRGAEAGVRDGEPYAGLALP